MMPATMEQLMPEEEVPTDDEITERLSTFEEVLLNAWTQIRLCGAPSAHERENVRDALTQLELLVLEAGKGAGMLRRWINDHR